MSALDTWQRHKRRRSVVSGRGVAQEAKTASPYQAPTTRVFCGIL